MSKEKKKSGLGILLNLVIYLKNGINIKMKNIKSLLKNGALIIIQNMKRIVNRRKYEI